ncbi:hypothetical protein [Streptomyces sp. NPDC047803]|uniref:hypothetical protein n=1 Tax=unclassified Streptomyces TaxID=2593676 RepID=UPI0033E646A9
MRAAHRTTWPGAFWNWLYDQGEEELDVTDEDGNPLYAVKVWEGQGTGRSSEPVGQADIEPGTWGKHAPWYVPCGVTGSLTDADTIKLINLAMSDGGGTWDDQELSCTLPAGHDAVSGYEHHIKAVATQEFGPGRETITWWASWLDLDLRREEAALFTAPMCDKEKTGPQGGEWGCLLIAGHDASGDDRHDWM